MDDPKSNPTWFKVGCTAVMATLVIYPVIGFIMFSRAWNWEDTTPRGPLADESDWPRPIRELRSAMDEQGIDTSAFEVYLVYGQPGSTESVVVCRMQDGASLMEFLTAHLELQSVSRSDAQQLGTSFVIEHTPAAWWPRPGHNADFFASKRLLTGDESDRYLVARDEGRHWVFVRYDYNF